LKAVVVLSGLAAAFTGAMRQITLYCADCHEDLVIESVAPNDNAAEPNHDVTDR
jgi:hypothetical protein